MEAMKTGPQPHKSLLPYYTFKVVGTGVGSGITETQTITLVVTQ